MTRYIPISNNAETLKQVNAILAIEKMKREFNAMSAEDRQRVIDLANT